MDPAIESRLSGSPRRLSRRFYSRETMQVAKDLVGRTLFHDSEHGLVGGRIVEVEAYLGSIDPGSHAFRGPTPRNAVMFGPAGHLYVYFTYGMHYCANIVTGREGVAGAVLLRAVEPTTGIEIMAKRRGLDDPRLLARGPGRLCQAFGLDRNHNGLDLIDSAVWVAPPRKLKAPVETSVRVGLRPGMDQPWRFFEPGPWASPTPRVRSRGG